MVKKVGFKLADWLRLIGFGWLASADDLADDLAKYLLRASRLLSDYSLALPSDRPTACVITSTGAG